MTLLWDTNALVDSGLFLAVVCCLVAVASTCTHMYMYGDGLLCLWYSMFVFDSCTVLVWWQLGGVQFPRIHKKQDKYQRLLHATYLCRCFKVLQYVPHATRCSDHYGRFLNTSRVADSVAVRSVAVNSNLRELRRKNGF